MQLELQKADNLKNFHSAQRYSVTILPPNHNYKIDATQGNSRNAHMSQNKQTNATIEQKMQVKLLENVKFYTHRKALCKARTEQEHIAEQNLRHLF